METCRPSTNANGLCRHGWSAGWHLVAVALVAGIAWGNAARAAHPADVADVAQHASALATETARARTCLLHLSGRDPSGHVPQVADWLPVCRHSPRGPVSLHWADYTSAHASVQYERMLDPQEGGRRLWLRWQWASQPRR